MLPEESAASETLRGLAEQLIELDFSHPAAFEIASRIGDEIRHAAQFALEARGEQIVAQSNVHPAFEPLLRQMMRIA